MGTAGSPVQRLTLRASFPGGRTVQRDRPHEPPRDAEDQQDRTVKGVQHRLGESPGREARERVLTKEGVFAVVENSVRLV